MSDTDPLPRPPRRRINGETWEFLGNTRITPRGAVVAVYRQATQRVELGFDLGFDLVMSRAGLVMGCVKNEDSTLLDYSYSQEYRSHFE